MDTLPGMLRSIASLRSGGVPCLCQRQCSRRAAIVLSNNTGSELSRMNIESAHQRSSSYSSRCSDAAQPIRLSVRMGHELMSDMLLLCAGLCIMETEACWKIGKHRG